MALDPNVLNYFLIILGGFGLVWSYRHLTGRSESKITDFEYAAFSTLWGIPVFFVFVWLLRDHTESIDVALKVPLTATPSLFAIGLVMGALGAWILGVAQSTLRRFR